MVIKARLLLIYASTITEKTVKQKKKKKEAILACKHFQTSHHIFQRDANFTPVTAEQLRLIPKKQGKF